MGRVRSELAAVARSINRIFLLVQKSLPSTIASEGNYPASVASYWNQGVRPAMPKHRQVFALSQQPVLDEAIPLT